MKPMCLDDFVWNLNLFPLSYLNLWVWHVTGFRLSSAGCCCQRRSTPWTPSERGWSGFIRCKTEGEYLLKCFWFCFYHWILYLISFPTGKWWYSQGHWCFIWWTLGGKEREDTKSFSIWKITWLGLAFCKFCCNGFFSLLIKRIFIMAAFLL